jgi:hypothetical protein
VAARLVVACRPTGKVLVHGSIAIQAVRAEAKKDKTMTKEVGKAYGLHEERYALAHGDAVYCFFVHPQMLLAGWSGGTSAMHHAKVCSCD